MRKSKSRGGNLISPDNVEIIRIARPENPHAERIKTQQNEQQLLFKQSQRMFQEQQLSGRLRELCQLFR